MSNFSDALNKHLFLVLLAAGVVLSCVVRMLIDDAIYGAVAAIAICIFCLVVYFVVAWRGGAEQHSPDNLYYMGLLFTLTSLIYSLITLFLIDVGDTDIKARTYNLIGSFGIALISTFVGILGRILLLPKVDLVSGLPPHGKENQAGMSAGRVTIDQPQLLPHAEIAEAAFKLRNELTQTIADMSVFRKTFFQATNETVQEADKARVAITQQAGKAAREQTKILSTLSATAVDKLAAAIDEIITPVKNARESLDELAAQQVKWMQQFVNMVEQSAGTLERSIGDSSAKLISAGEKFEIAFDSVQESSQAITRKLQSTGESVHDFSSSIRQSVKLFADIADEIEQVENALTGSAKAFTGSFDIASKVMPQYTQQFEKLITVLRQEAEQWQSMTQEVRGSLAQAVEKLTEVVKHN